MLKVNNKEARMTSKVSSPPPNIGPTNLTGFYGISEYSRLNNYTREKVNENIRNFFIVA